MANNNFAAFCSDLDLELRNLGRLSSELKDALPGIGNPPTPFEVRAIGSIIHDFYTGAEKIFERIATKIDGDMPASSGWHTQLLKRMGTAVPNIRPAVIDKILEDKLSELLGFRHLFRNIYGFELKWDRCKVLAGKIDCIYSDLAKQITSFTIFLKSL